MKRSVIFLQKDAVSPLSCLRSAARFFWIMQSQSDDKPPAFILAFIISLFAVIVMVLASKFERFKN